MARKIYDITSGHYIMLNEDEQDTSFNAGEKNGENDAQQAKEEEQQQTNKSVEQDPQIQQIDAQQDAEQKRYETAKNMMQDSWERQIQTLRDTLTAAEKAAAEADTQTPYDRVQTNRDVLGIRKQIVQAELKHAEDISRIEVEHARNIAKIENGRLDQLQKMANEGAARLPEKYRGVLNESNISQAKIYVNNLVGQEDRHLLGGMVDFNHAFADSGLVYGRDKNGYYVLCIDQEDFDRLYRTMQECGYQRDAVLATVMPQLLDRSGFVTSQS